MIAIMRSGQKMCVGYWSGRIPEISKLHFQSFIANQGDWKYCLYLDEDLDDYAHDHNVELVLSSGIEVKRFSLKELMLKNGIFSHRGALISNLSFSKRFHNLTMRVFHKATAGNWSSINGNLGSRQGWHPKFGYAPGHGLASSNFDTDLRFRSDVFRCLVASEFPDDDILYTDIDNCFIRPLSECLNGEALTYRWEDEDFANTAWLYLPANAKVARAQLLKAVDAGLSAKPWVMFHEDRCKSMGIAILPTDLFDPGWSKDSLSWGKTDLFFQKCNESEPLFREVLDRNIAVHWHNHWETIPESGSTYDLLLRHFSRNES